MRRVAFVLAALLLTSAPLGCSRSDPTGDSEGVVDTDLMAFLSEARALHHQANLKEDAGDLGGAIDAMDRLTRAQRPHPRTPAPEVDEVLADAFARMAELQLKANRLEHAELSVRKGLERAPQPTYFRGHLLEVEGLVEEARAASFADAGNVEGASRARQRAIELLEEVVKIQDQVIQRSLAREAGAESKP